MVLDGFGASAGARCPVPVPAPAAAPGAGARHHRLAPGAWRPAPAPPRPLLAYSVYLSLNRKKHNFPWWGPHKQETICILAYSESSFCCFLYPFGLFFRLSGQIIRLFSALFAYSDTPKTFCCLFGGILVYPGRIV
jgi:hypothetical protein